MADERELPKAGIYHIRVQGYLDEKWADWFEGFAMASRDSGETLLSGPVVDQAALHGALGKIRGLGLPLLLVMRTDCPCSSKNCARHGQCQECAAHHGANGKLAYCFRSNAKWDRQCMALAKANRDFQMSENTQKTPRCGDCALRRRAEAKPKSLLGRFWYWHIKWCPGWKAYQEYLARQNA
jgi:hypothetical protein